MEDTETTQQPIYLAGSDSQTGEKINLTGSWFVYFGLDTLQGKIEGCRILTLKGNFDPDNLIDILTDAIYGDLPDNAKEFIDNSGQRVVIRVFNRI